MGLRDVLRTVADALRPPGAETPPEEEPALVLPPTVTAEQVEALVFDWSPDAVTDEGLIEIPYRLDVLGPIHRDDPGWPDAAVSARFQTAYVTRWRRGVERDGSWVEDARHGLVNGLARRLGGQVRDKAGGAWRDPARGDPPPPMVLAPRRVTIKKARELFARLYPYPDVDYEQDGMYVLDAEPAGLHVQWILPPVFPLARREPWYRRQGELTEYVLLLPQPPRDRAEVADVLRTIAEATGGIALDQEGFPWLPPDRPAQAS